MTTRRRSRQRIGPNDLSVSIRLISPARLDCVLRIRSVPSRRFRRSNQTPAGRRRRPNGCRPTGESVMAKKTDYVWPDPFRRIPSSTATSEYKINGRRHFRVPRERACSIPSSLGRYVDIYRHHAAVFARYCADGRFSEKQLRTIERLYIDGMSLQQFARAEGVSPQAILARIEGLANRAYVFYCWWRSVNGGRRRKR